MQSLTYLRAEIDKIDEDIIGLLAKRFSATKQVGQLKAAAGLPAVDASREQDQQARYMALSAMHGLSPEMVTRMFRIVIDEVVSNHRAVLNQAGD